MEYLGKNIKKLGFGFMRLPKKDGAIDIEQAKEMTDLFMEAGFTYFDTAWAYEGSEDALRKALVERYPRESYQLATKVSAWIDCKNKQDAFDQIETSLKRTGAGYFDYYLLHNLGEGRTRYYDDFDVWSWVQEKKREGLVRHAGFSFHSTAGELDELLTKHPEMEFVQLQINYADWEDRTIQSRACYETARRHGKPVVIMEPVKGGLLAAPPQSVTDIFRAVESEASAASWGLRFAADLEGVITVLSGMGSLEQMRDNISSLKDFTGLTDRQREAVERARRELSKLFVIPCTSCDYCAKVCPENIGISGTFTAMNVLAAYGNKERALSQEAWLVGRHWKARATQCVKCGACEEVCPQHISIRDELEKACRKLFD